MYISSSGAQQPQKLFLLIMSCREALRDMRHAGTSHFFKVNSRNLPTKRDWKAKVSSASPSSERILNRDTDEIHSDEGLRRSSSRFFTISLSQAATWIRPPRHDLSRLKWASNIFFKKIEQDIIEAIDGRRAR